MSSAIISRGHGGPAASQGMIKENKIETLPSLIRVFICQSAIPQQENLHSGRCLELLGKRLPAGWFLGSGAFEPTVSGYLEGAACILF